VPHWYKVGTSKDYMYSNLAQNKCASDCMDIYMSRTLFGTIRIFYKDMKPSCVKGTPIQINCKQFHNPIYQDKWDNFYVITYDNEKSPKPIERSKSAFLDARNFKAATIPTE